MLTFFIILIVLGAAVFILQGYTNARILEHRIAALNGFNATFQQVGSDGRSALAIDTRRQLICLAKKESKQVRLIAYRDILSVELLEDGNAVTREESKSVVGRALLGGLILGPVGAVVGGMSGLGGYTATTTQTVDSIDLRIVVNEMREPLFLLNFLNASTPKRSRDYESAAGQANKWRARIAAAMRQGDDATLPPTINVTSSEPWMCADCHSPVYTGQKFCHECGARIA